MKKDEERGGSGRRKRKDGMRKEKDSRRKKKEALREEGQCQGRKFPVGGFGNCPVPLRGGEKGRRIWGLAGSFEAHFIGENKAAPQPGGEPQNSPSTSQNFWEGSLYTFLQPTPNPQKPWNILRFWGGNPSFPVSRAGFASQKLGGGIGGTPVSRRLMKVSGGDGHSRGVANGGQSGIPDPRGFGGGLDTPSLVWDWFGVGGRPAIPHP